MPMQVTSCPEGGFCPSISFQYFLRSREIMGEPCRQMSYAEAALLVSISDVMVALGALVVFPWCVG